MSTEPSCRHEQASKEASKAYRHDTNLALSRLDDAGTVGAYQSAACLLFQASLDLDHVMLWNACRGRESWVKKR